MSHGLTSTKRLLPIPWPQEEQGFGGDPVISSTVMTGNSGTYREQQRHLGQPQAAWPPHTCQEETLMNWLETLNIVNTL